MQNIEQDKASHKKTIILSIILILLIVLMVIFTSYIKKQESQIKIDEKNYKLEIYQTEYNNNQLCINLQLSSCTKIAFEIPTRTENAEILAVAYDNYVLYLDEEIYLYNNDTKKTEKINISKNATNYSLEYSDNDKNLYGIIYEENSKKSYYNIKKSKILYENQYDEIQIVNENLIQANNILNKSDSFNINAYLLDSNEEKEPYITLNDKYCINFRQKGSTNKYYIEVEQGCTAVNSKLSYYTKDFRQITDFLNYESYSLDLSSNLLVSINENTINKYNFKGELIKTYKESGKIVAIYSDLYTLIQDNILYIKDYEGQEYKLMNWNANYYYYSNIINNISIESIIGSDRENGYYFIIGYNKSEESSGIMYYFNPTTKELKKWKIDRIANYY